ncbi:MAG: pirin family protein [Candidatus Omnitrophica bacterium]|nr:pirin family protein [Candidatus Omnitrophota bacterium]
MEYAKINIRKASDRGHADHGWLNSYHTFSFADYHDPQHMGFRSLRVINDDTVKGGMGFTKHQHRDMEIISYVIDGAMEHADSMGNGSVIRRGHVQRISAGKGIAHSEYNHSGSDPVHFLQIWIQPDRKGLEPSYEELPVAAEGGGLRLIGSPEGKEGGVTIHQDARLYFGRMNAGATLAHNTAAGRGIWVQVIHGDVTVAGQTLSTGDGMSIENLEEVPIGADSQTEFLLFDLH